MLEGDLDTSHVSFLHLGGLRAEDQPPGSFSDYQLRQRSAAFEVVDTPGGAAYGARRPAAPGHSYWRIAQWCFPFYSFTPPGVLGLKMGGNARVPLDDEHTLAFVMASSSTPTPPDVMPNGSGWLERFRTPGNPANDFLIDREIQRRNQGVPGYTGIRSFGMQDAAMSTGMGPVLDRSDEHLGSSDAMIIRIRRRLLSALDAYERQGTPPPGVDRPEVYAVRSGGIFLADGQDWEPATRELRRAFVDHSDLDATINGPF
jgi:hypothetical protein